MKPGLLALVLTALEVSAGVVSDAGIGYSIDLPANWVQVKTRDIQHHFKDGTSAYPSKISILKYAIDKADYPTPESWTQAQFIGYKLAVETSVFPFGSVAYFDSSQSRKLGPYWAPEAFSVMFPGDGQRTYCEFIRFCARGGHGYEIYAIGDSTDMMNRVDFYAGIIATVTLSEPVVSLAPAPSRRVAPGSLPILSRDARGRLLFRPEGSLRRATQVFGRPRPSDPP